MISNIIFEIKKDKMLYEYLKYHSYWYEILKDDESKIKDMIKSFKNELKINPEDRLKEISNKIELLKSILEIIT